MTDNDIKKALDKSIKLELKTSCDDCIAKCESYCHWKLLVCIRDLINRQQAEIERLHKELTRQQLKNNMLYETAKEVKTEAVKEFAEKVETELYERVSENIRKRNPHWYIAKRIVRETAIEMTEESK